jgi:hypothetical protein
VGREGRGGIFIFIHLFIYLFICLFIYLFLGPRYYHWATLPLSIDWRKGCQHQGDHWKVRWNFDQLPWVGANLRHYHVSSDFHFSIDFLNSPSWNRIRGDKKNVDACEKFLKSEIKRIIESSFVLEVPLFTQFVKYIIGKSGATLTQIKEETDTRISIPKDSTETAIIKITGSLHSCALMLRLWPLFFILGTQKNCEAARDRILKIQTEQANIVTETIDIEPKFHNAIIGAKGKVLKDIVQQCGGVQVNFPKEKGSSKVSLRGGKEDVEKAKKLLLELANEKVMAGVNHNDCSPQLSSLLFRSSMNIVIYNDYRLFRFCSFLTPFRPSGPE